MRFRYPVPFPCMAPGNELRALFYAGRLSKRQGFVAMFAGLTACK